MGKRASKNRFERHGNTISIFHPDKGLIAQTTYRDDYIDELQSVTWNLNDKGYPGNSKLGGLHRYIMKKWYGEDILNEMTKADFVVDHINNNSMDATIENLSFLSSDENKAKAFTVDKQRNQLLRKIALNIFKDFDTGYYQITIFFNKEMCYVNPENNTRCVVSAVRLLYVDDYPLVLNDARYILLSCKNGAGFDLSKLNYIDIEIEKAKYCIIPDKNNYNPFPIIDGVPYIILDEYTYMAKINPKKNWKPSTSKNNLEV